MQRVRAVSFSTLGDAFSREGQHLVFTYVLAMATAGPGHHVVENLSRMGESIVCHVHLEAELAAAHVKVFTNDIRHMLEEKFSTDSSFCLQ